MKKLEDFNLNVIQEDAALTVRGGHSCGGTITERYTQCSFFSCHTGDWDDEGCCDAE